MKKDISFYDKSRRLYNPYVYEDCDVCDNTQYECDCIDCNCRLCNICCGFPCICGRLLYLFLNNKLTVPQNIDTPPSSPGFKSMDTNISSDSLPEYSDN